MRTLLLSTLLPLTACASAAQPLPEGPPPEYEAPRSYQPDANIDQIGAPGEAVPLESDVPTATSSGEGADGPSSEPPQQATEGHDGSTSAEGAETEGEADDADPAKAPPPK